MLVVLPAQDPDVGHRVVPAHAHGLHMVELEEPAFLAPPPAAIDERTSPAIPVEHRPSHGGGDAARAPGAGPGPAGLARLAEALCEEALGQRIHGAFDDVGEIPVGHLVTDKLLELPELVDLAPARRELDPEPVR